MIVFKILINILGKFETHRVCVKQNVCNNFNNLIILKKIDSQSVKTQMHVFENRLYTQTP